MSEYSFYEKIFTKDSYATMLDQEATGPGAKLGLILTSTWLT